jgi:hypothetical protein
VHEGLEAGHGGVDDEGERSGLVGRGEGLDELEERLYNNNNHNHFSF